MWWWVSWYLCLLDCESELPYGNRNHRYKWIHWGIGDTFGSLCRWRDSRRRNILFKFHLWTYTQRHTQAIHSPSLLIGIQLVTWATTRHLPLCTRVDNNSCTSTMLIRLYIIDRCNGLYFCHKKTPFCFLWKPAHTEVKPAFRIDSVVGVCPVQHTRQSILKFWYLPNQFYVSRLEIAVYENVSLSRAQKKLVSFGWLLVFIFIGLFFLHVINKIIISNHIQSILL